MSYAGEIWTKSYGPNPDIEFAICHVVRHGNVNSIQNTYTVINPTMEPYCIRIAVPCNVTFRKLTIFFPWQVALNMADPFKLNKKRP